MRNIIKYVGILLVIVGIVLVMRNLFSKDTDWSSDKVSYYSAEISVLDKQSKSFVVGAEMVLKDSDGKVIDEWTTESGAHKVNKLEKGSYTLTQVEAADYYHLNEEKITFQIKNRDKDVLMYNTKMTETEIEEERVKNTTSEETAVDNTLSSKSILSVIISVVAIGLGTVIIYKEKKSC